MCYISSNRTTTYVNHTNINGVIGKLLELINSLFTRINMQSRWQCNWNWLLSYNKPFSSAHLCTVYLFLSLLVRWFSLSLFAYFVTNWFDFCSFFYIPFFWACSIAVVCLACLICDYIYTYYIFFGMGQVNIFFLLQSWQFENIFINFY